MKHFSPAWYGRTPVLLALDRGISHEACRLYAVLSAHVFQGNTARIGQRRLGEMFGWSAATVCRRIRELEVAGYLEKGASDRGRRAFYVLTSPIFAQKQRSGAQEVVSAPSGGRRLASVRKEAS